jgi:hypothetical protein
MPVAQLRLWNHGREPARPVRDEKHSSARGGRVLLDVYNAEAAVRLPLSAVEERGGRVLRTTRSWNGRRLSVELEYSDAADIARHDWEILTPLELAGWGADAGLAEVVRCAWFDEAIAPGADHLRMQLLFERVE